MATFDEVQFDWHDSTMSYPKRFQRPTTPAPIQITKSVMEVLLLLYRYKILNSEHIHAHLAHRSVDGIRRTLQRMFMAHLIDRPQDQIYYGRCEYMIYRLNPKGLQELSQSPAQAHTVTAPKGAMGMALGNEFRHSMMICETLSSLELGAIAAGVRFISWNEIIENYTGDSDPFVFTANYDYPLPGGATKPVRNHRIKPDGFFGLEYPDGKKAYFALEAEHTSPNNPTSDKRAATRSSTKKKFIAYRDIVASGEYKKLGIGNMRVLVIAPMPKVLANKFTVLEGVVPESALFLGNCVPVYGANFSQPRPFPKLFDAPWVRVGLPPEKINASTMRA